MKDKRKEKFYKLAKENSESKLKRNVDYFTAGFISFLTASFFILIETGKDIILKSNWGIITLDIIILIVLGFLLFYSFIQHQRYYPALRMKEEKKDISKKKAYEFIEEYFKK